MFDQWVVVTEVDKVDSSFAEVGKTIAVTSGEAVTNEDGVREKIELNLVLFVELEFNKV